MMKFQRFRLIALVTLLCSVSPSLPSELSVFSTSPAIAQTSESRKAEAERLFEQGNQQYHAEEPDAAIQSWQQALTIYQEIGDRLGEAASLGNIAIVDRGRGEYAKALEALERVGEIMQELDDLNGQVRVLQQLGLLYRALGNDERAEDLLTEQLKRARDIPNRAEEAAAQGNLGLIYMDMERYDDAIDAMEEQLTIAREINDEGQQENALANLGLVNEASNNYDEALSYYERVLALRQARGDWIGEGYILGSMGLLYRRMRDYSQAIRAIRRYVESARESGDRRGEGVALNNLGVVLYESDNIEEAVSTLYAAIEIRESLRPGLDDTQKISIDNANHSTFGTLQVALIEQKEIDRALEISERGRARAFWELSSQNLSLPSGENTELIAIEQIQQIARQQNATLVEYSIVPNEKLYIYVVQPTGEIEFRAVDLPEDISLAELVDNGRDCIIHKRQCRGNRDRTLPTVGDLVEFNDDQFEEPWQVVEVDVRQGTLKVKLEGFEGEPIERSITDVAAIVNAFNRPRLQQLHQLLIQPIADLLPDDENERVIFIPHQQLFLVPFPALQDEAGNYLIEKHTILSAPSIQMLALTRQARRGDGETGGRGEVLVVGNPTMPSIWNPETEETERLSNLPDAESEAVAIANLFNTQPFIKGDATESAVTQQMPTARLIHLATHGLLHYGILEETGVRDFPGAIALAPDNGEDGFLTSAELQEMELQAELVVLSACKTGQGDITSDGVIGLSRSLVAAGVPSLIVSLWSVEDDTTAELMIRFYQNLDGTDDKAQALRQAMLDTMAEHPNPRNWAAFTLIGEAF